MPYSRKTLPNKLQWKEEAKNYIKKRVLLQKQTAKQLENFEIEGK